MRKINIPTAFANTAGRGAFVDLRSPKYSNVDTEISDISNSLDGNTVITLGLIEDTSPNKGTIVMDGANVISDGVTIAQPGVKPYYRFGMLYLGNEAGANTAATSINVYDLSSSGDAVDTLPGEETVELNFRIGIFHGESQGYTDAAGSSFGTSFVGSNTGSAFQQGYLKSNTSAVFPGTYPNKYPNPSSGTVTNWNISFDEDSPSANISVITGKVLVPASRVYSNAVGEGSNLPPYVSVPLTIPFVFGNESAPKFTTSLLLSEGPAINLGPKSVVGHINGIPLSDSVGNEDGEVAAVYDPLTDTGFANVTSMAGWYENSDKLLELDITNHKFGNVTSFSSLFHNAANLRKLNQVGESGVGGVSYPFRYSYSLEYDNAFTNTNLDVSSVDDILISIEAAGTSGGRLDQSGGSAPSLLGQEAIDKLTNRGWTINVEGGYKSPKEFSDLFAEGQEGFYSDLSNTETTQFSSWQYLVGTTGNATPVASKGAIIQANNDVWIKSITIISKRIQTLKMFIAQVDETDGYKVTSILYNDGEAQYGDELVKFDVGNIKFEAGKYYIVTPVRTDGANNTAVDVWQGNASNITSPDGNLRMVFGRDLANNNPGVGTKFSGAGWPCDQTFEYSTEPPVVGLLDGLFQDSAGTIPVTSHDQPVGKIVRGAGTVDLVQTVSASRLTMARWPRGGRRNFLMWTEQFQGKWSTGAFSGGAKVTDNVDTMSGMQVSKVEATAGGSALWPGNTIQSTIVIDEGSSVTASAYLKEGLATGTITRVELRNSAALGSSRWAQSPSAVYGADISRFHASTVIPAGYTTAVMTLPTGYSFHGANFYVTRTQLELGNNLTPYQKVTTANDVTEEGVESLWHLYNDGGDSLRTSAPVPAGTYGYSYVDIYGNIVFDTLESDGTTPLTVLTDGGRFFTPIIRQGDFSLGEKLMIERKWSAKFQTPQDIAEAFVDNRIGAFFDLSTPNTCYTDALGMPAHSANEGDYIGFIRRSLGVLDVRQYDSTRFPKYENGHLVFDEANELQLDFGGLGEVSASMLWGSDEGTMYTKLPTIKGSINLSLFAKWAGMSRAKYILVLEGEMTPTQLISFRKWMQENGCGQDILKTTYPFINSEAGFYGGELIPENLWQDAAGTVPVTAIGDKIGRIDRIDGTHDLVQSVSGDRPALARWPRGGPPNRLQYPDDITNSVWDKNNVAVSSDNVITYTPTTGHNNGLDQPIPDSTANKTYTIVAAISGVGKVRLKNTHGMVINNWSDNIELTPEIRTYSFTVTNNSNPGNGTQRWGISISTDNVPFTCKVHYIGAFEGDSDNVIEPGVPSLYHINTTGNKSMLTETAMPAGEYGVAWVDPYGIVEFDVVQSDGINPLQLLDNMDRFLEPPIVRLGRFDLDEMERIAKQWEDKYLDDESKAWVFDPAKYLFLGGRRGTFIDFSDMSTLFQDAAGTIPVTADGDPIGLALDKSGNGRHFVQEVMTARPTYRDTDGPPRAVFDKIDDNGEFDFSEGGSFEGAYRYGSVEGLIKGVISVSNSSPLEFWRGPTQIQFRNVTAMMIVEGELPNSIDAGVTRWLVDNGSGIDGSSVPNKGYMFYATRLVEIDCSHWAPSVDVNRMFLDSGLRSFKGKNVVGSITTKFGLMFWRIGALIEFDDIAYWDVSSITDRIGLAHVPNNTETYDKILEMWGSQSVKSGGGIEYSNGRYTPGGAAEAGRDSLITQGWTIIDGGPVT